LDLESSLEENEEKKAGESASAMRFPDIFTILELPKNADTASMDRNELITILEEMEQKVAEDESLLADAMMTKKQKQELQNDYDIRS